MPDRTVPFSATQITKVDRLSVRIANSKVSKENLPGVVMPIFRSGELREQQETVSIVLATGNSQLKFLEALSTNKQLDWSRIILFHLDEYLGISPEHLGSFRYYLRTKVEQKVQPYIFHYLEGDAAQPLEECDRYSKSVYVGYWR